MTCFAVFEFLPYFQELIIPMRYLSNGWRKREKHLGAGLQEKISTLSTAIKIIYDWVPSTFRLMFVLVVSV